MHELTVTDTFFDKGARTKNSCELRGVVLLHIQSAKSLSAESSSNERAMNETRAEPGWPIKSSANRIQAKDGRMKLWRRIDQRWW